MNDRSIFIATSNAGKLRDFAAAARADRIEVLPLPGFAALPSVEEDGATFQANARKKAEHYSALAPGLLLLADDSGLEVSALGGAPGVHSARFAAASSTIGNAPDEANNHKLLSLLAAKSNRSARFVAVIAAAFDGNTLATFTGEVDGEIASSPRGNGGFGYDPLFMVAGKGKTMAELSADEKAAVSHRGRAFRRFLEWYRSQPSGFAKIRAGQ